MKKEKTESAKCLLFEDYILARGKKCAGRYLQVAQRFLEVKPGEEEPFEARHVNRFLASLSRGGARGRTLRWNYVVKSFFRALGHPSSISIGDRGGHHVPSHRHCPTPGQDGIHRAKDLLPFI